MTNVYECIIIWNDINLDINCVKKYVFIFINTIFSILLREKIKI